MDVNAKINWMPGMELTTHTFRLLEKSLDFKQRLALKAALGENRLGLLPATEFKGKGMFVKNNFEITPLKVTAILSSGRLIDVDEDISVQIPMLYGDEYYLAAGFGETVHEYEREGVPFVRDNYSFSVKSLEELKKGDFFPVARFKVKDGIFSIDDSFIPPCLFISENQEFHKYKDNYIELLEKIARHSNMEEGDAKRCFIRYLFQLKSLYSNASVKEFISLASEICQAADYFIIKPHTGNNLIIEIPDYYDIEKWLLWLKGYLEGAVSVLDKVVLVDNSIDYDALLEQAKRELYERLSPELLEKLPARIKDELYKEIIGRLKDSLPAYLLEKINELKNQVSGEVTENITPKLFDDLYDKLYNALYVKPEEEDEFIPLI